MATKLATVEGLYCKQYIDPTLATNGCCDKVCCYEVHALENNEKKGKALFTFKEESSCMSRQFLSTDCRPLDMTVVNLQNDGNDEPCLKIIRPCKCSFCCCNRQEMQIQWIEKKQQKFLGKIVDPWDCFNHSVAFH